MLADGLSWRLYLRHRGYPCIISCFTVHSRTPIPRISRWLGHLLKQFTRFSDLTRQFDR
jgi:hypothetical protein